MRRQRIWIVVAILAMGSCQGAAAAGPTACTIVEGAEVAGVKIGMAVAAALAVTGPPTKQQPSGTAVTYLLRQPWAYMIADGGLVRQIGSRTPACRTTRGVGPGSSGRQVLGAYAGSQVSTVTPTEGGDIVSYPYVGVAFLIRQDRVDTVEIFRAEGAAGVRPPTPTPGQVATGMPGIPGSPTPRPSPTTAPGTWGVSGLTGRVEDAVLVVNGTVENRSSGLSVYVEVRALGASGRVLGQGEIPVVPNPVPNNGTASFEVRIPVADIVSRFAVTVRPLGAVTGALVQVTGDVAKDRQQFASIVARQLEVSVQASRNPPTTDSFSITVANRSTMVVSSASVGADFTVTCLTQTADRAARRNFTEVRSASAVVQQLRPGASVTVPLLIGPGTCTDFGTWSVKTRVGDVKIAEGD